MTPEVTLVLAVYLAVTALVIAAVHAYDLGRDELAKRWRLAWLALNGRDYSQPRLDYPLMDQFQLPDPNSADDPLGAYLLRASDAERRYFALTHLLEEVRDDPLQMGNAGVSDWDRLARQVERLTWKARDDAREAIMNRLETRHTRDEEQARETWVIEDPLLNYRRVVRLDDREIVREDLRRASVSQAVDRTPDVILNEVLGEAHV